MPDLKDILREEYEKSIVELMDPHALMSMIEAVMSHPIPKILEETGARERERVIRLPNIMATEISVGQKPGSEERQQFELWMGNIGMGGGEEASDVSRKLMTITNFFAKPAANLATATIPETLSYLMFLNQFVYMLKEFNAAVAGFLWEPFLAALFGGKSEQVPTSRGDISDIRIYTSGSPDQPISLKILNEAGVVKGSFYDLINHFANGGTEMRYIIVVKDQSAIKKEISAVTFYEFNITVQSFFDWIGTVEHEEVAVMGEKKFTLERGLAGTVTGIVLKAGDKKGPQKEGGPYIWIRHSMRSRGKRQGEKWLPLGRQDPESGIIDTKSWKRFRETADEINLQGAQSGQIAMDTRLIARVALFAGGGVGGAKPKKTYTRETEAVAGMMGVGSKETERLWGGIEKLSQWAALREKWIEELGPENGSIKLFTAMRDGIPEEGIDRAPGASGKAAGKAEEGSGTQFHITPKHYKGLGIGGAKGLGTLRITDAEVIKFFEESAKNMNEELITMFNKLADLNDNIGRFFLANCGQSEEGVEKCTDKDAAKRTEAGQDAINDSKELEAAVVKSVSGMQ